MKYFLYNNKSKGLSLVETLVAIAIMSLLILSAVSLITTLSSSERKNRAVTETEWQTSFILDSIAQTIRNASAITSPTITATSTSATFTLSALPLESPTQFSLSGGKVMVSKAGTAAIPLSSNAVTVTSLVFQNITASGTKGAIRVSVGVTYNNPQNKIDLTYSTSRKMTITLR